MRRKAILLIALLALAASQCDRPQTPLPSNDEPALFESPPTKDVVRLSDASRELVGIRVAKAEYEQCRSVLKAMGKILAPQPQMAIVSHAFPARVAEVHVQAGDWVERQQPLITLDSQDVGEAKSEFYKATANHELAKLNFEREQRLLKNGIGIKKDFVAAEAEYKVAQANLEAAEKRLHVLGFSEEEVKEIASTHQINPAITLYSPIAGKVVDIQAVRGAMVDQSTEILTVVDPRLLWVDAEVYEKDIAKIKIGQKAEITVPAYPGRTFIGKTSYIGDVVNEETRTITVRAEVANDQQLLKPGMFADVNILLDENYQMLVVPTAAVLEEGHQRIVFVKEEEHFVRRDVETGPVDGEYQQIVDGLEAGEEVVVEGNHQLKSKLQEEVLKAAGVH